MFLYSVTVDSKGGTMLQSAVWAVAASTRDVIGAMMAITSSMQTVTASTRDVTDAVWAVTKGRVVFYGRCVECCSHHFGYCRRHHVCVVLNDLCGVLNPLCELLHHPSGMMFLLCVIHKHYVGYHILCVGCYSLYARYMCAMRAVATST